MVVWRAHIWWIWKTSHVPWIHSLFAHRDAAWDLLIWEAAVIWSEAEQVLCPVAAVTLPPSFSSRASCQRTKKIFDVFPPCKSDVVGVFRYLILRHWTQQKGRNTHLKNWKLKKLRRKAAEESQRAKATGRCKHVLGSKATKGLIWRRKKNSGERARKNSRRMSSAVVQLPTRGWGSQLRHQTHRGQRGPKNPQVAVTSPTPPVNSADGAP